MPKDRVTFHLHLCVHEWDKSNFDNLMQTELCKDRETTCEHFEKLLNHIITNIKTMYAKGKQISQLCEKVNTNKL